MVRPEELVAAIESNCVRSGEKDLYLYLHVPFCSSKCLFCDWVAEIPTSRLLSDAPARSEYTRPLCEQIRFYGQELSRIGYKPRLMYWGGGTPTRLSGPAMKAIRDALDESFEMSRVVEFTVETTPNDLTAEVLESLASIGVNRISIGVQSFDERQLHRSGRAHTPEQAEEAVRLARRHGFQNVNIDLISAFPGEELDSFRESLKRGIQLEPDHIAIYSYRATRQTVMAMQISRGYRKSLTVDRMIESYELAQDVLEQAGYREYLYNCFAKSASREFQAGLHSYGMKCDTFGFGSGARSVIARHALANTNGNYHGFVHDPLAFDACVPIFQGQPNILTDLISNSFMTHDGLLFDRFLTRTGVPIEEALTVPTVQGWFQFMANCGARIEQWDDRYRLGPKSIHRVFLTYLSYVTNPRLAIA